MAIAISHAIITQKKKKNSRNSDVCILIYDQGTSHPICSFPFANSIINRGAHLHNLSGGVYTQRKTITLQKKIKNIKRLQKFYQTLMNKKKQKSKLMTIDYRIILADGRIKECKDGSSLLLHVHLISISKQEKRNSSFI